jgi:hypothetical protein
LYLFSATETASVCSLNHSGALHCWPPGRASDSEPLKNISQIEHSRHRSVANYLVNLMAGLIAYTYREKKPSLNIRVKEQLQFPALGL